MKLLALLATYLGVAAGLFGGLVGGVLWLVKPEPAARHAPRVAPISPRIAESIERKMAPASVTPAAQATETKVEPVKPVMQEANVALAHAPRRVQLRELTPQRTLKRKPPRDERSVALHDVPPAAEAAPARAPVSTVRTDFPY